MIETVFCIDDDPITLMLCEKVFNKTAFCNKTIKALNGELALNYFKELVLNNSENKTIPNLILLDLNMPVINGWEFLQVFENEYITQLTDLKVIILSSSLNPDDKEIIKKHPVIIDFITKPLTIESVENLKNHSELRHFFTDGI